MSPYFAVNPATVHADVCSQLFLLGGQLAAKPRRSRLLGQALYIDLLILTPDHLKGTAASSTKDRIVGIGTAGMTFYAAADQCIHWYQAALQR
jgi:hypothetical protein